MQTIYICVYVDTFKHTGHTSQWFKRSHVTQLNTLVLGRGQWFTGGQRKHCCVGWCAGVHTTDITVLLSNQVTISKFCLTFTCMYLRLEQTVLNDPPEGEFRRYSITKTRKRTNNYVYRIRVEYNRNITRAIRHETPKIQATVVQLRAIWQLDCCCVPGSDATKTDCTDVGWVFSSILSVCSWSQTASRQTQILHSGGNSLKSHALVSPLQGFLAIHCTNYGFVFFHEYICVLMSLHVGGCCCTTCSG